MGAVELQLLGSPSSAHRDHGGEVLSVQIGALNGAVVGFRLMCRDTVSTAMPSGSALRPATRTC